MKISHVVNGAAALLITFGVVILVAGAYVRHQNAALQTQPQTATGITRQPLDPASLSGQPVELRIDALHISNPVIDGFFNADQGQWTLTTDKVQFAALSIRPNDKQGLTFMYGHNRKEVFNRLPAITPGTIATIRTSNGHLFTYRFVSSQIVKPADASVFQYDGPPKLVLQTCTGLFYQNRQLFSFEFVGVQHA